MKETYEFINVTEMVEAMEKHGGNFIPNNRPKELKIGFLDLETRDLFLIRIVKLKTSLDKVLVNEVINNKFKLCNRLSTNTNVMKPDSDEERGNFINISEFLNEVENRLKNNYTLYSEIMCNDLKLGFVYSKYIKTEKADKDTTVEDLVLKMQNDFDKNIISEDLYEDHGDFTIHLSDFYETFDVRNIKHYALLNLLVHQSFFKDKDINELFLNIIKE